MHARLALPLALAAALAAGGSALAQAKPSKRLVPPPPPAADAPVPAPKPAVAVTTLTAPRRLSGLVGMSPVGDPGPACRAQCSKDRYVCRANDPEDCDARWIPCLQACSVR